MHHPNTTFVLGSLFVIGWAMPLLAQIPRGHCVASSFTMAGAPNGGLWTFHSHGSPATAITGLPPDLTGVGLVAPAGAGAVLVSDRTGDVVVGEHTPPGQVLHVHVITLAGTTATNVLSYPLGTVSATGLGSTDQLAWSGDDILVLNRRNALVAGPLAGYSLGLVRPSYGPPGTPGTVVPLAMASSMSGTVNAMALHPQQGDAFIATFAGGASSIYRVPLTPPYAPLLLATLPHIVLNLAIDADGLLLAGIGFAGVGVDVVYALSTATGAVVASSGAGWPTTPFAFQSINGLTCDFATGDLLFVDDSLRMAFRAARLGGGAYAPPVQIAAGLQDFASGIAYRAPVTAYGVHTPSTFAHAWRTSLLPGGNPTRGNLAFQLSMLPNASTAPTLLGVSAGVPTPPPLPTPFGFTLLLHPATLVVPTAFATPPPTIPLAIPGNPALAGQDFFFQTLHLEPAGFAASNGLWLTPF